MSKKTKFLFGNRKSPIPFNDALKWEATRPQWKQVHGVAIAEVHSLGQECGAVDGLWTQKANLPIAVVTADCIPLVLYRRDQKAAAVLHVGWRGMIAHLPNHFFKNLPSELKEPREWIAAIGPSIRACCYEFGNDDLEQFSRAFPEVERASLRPKSGYLNLIAPLEHELSSLGVELESIHPDCTYCAHDTDDTPRYFSYRRGDRNSRQYTVLIQED